MHGKLILVALGIGFVLTLGCTAGDIESVTIGRQVWMKKNLDIDVPGSKCYDNDPENCKKYGRLYDWATAMALPSECNRFLCPNLVKNIHRGICPEGWHIPTNEEWDVLYKFVDSSYVVDNYYSKTAGKHLKAKSGWNGDGNGEDTYGFAALPGGFGFEDGRFRHVGSKGAWWNAGRHSAPNAVCRYMDYSEYAYWNTSLKAGSWFSVRCLQD